MSRSFKTRIPKGRNAGFSLLEVIFAITILSFGMVGFLSLFSEMMRTTTDDEFTMTGSHLAVQKLEEVLADKAAHGYDGISTGSAEETIDYGNQSFLRQTSIRWVESTDLKTGSSEDTGFKRVDVTVSWKGDSPQQVQMMSLITNY